eukprot:2334859-Amphidinium_carterae.1
MFGNVSLTSGSSLIAIISANIVLACCSILKDEKQQRLQCQAAEAVTALNSNLQRGSTLQKGQEYQTISQMTLDDTSQKNIAEELVSTHLVKTNHAQSIAVQC